MTADSRDTSGMAHDRGPANPSRNSVDQVSPLPRIGSSATLQVFSNSLRDARRSADNMLQSAQNSEPVLRIRSEIDQWETSVRADVLRAHRSATSQLERLKFSEPIASSLARGSAGMLPAGVDDRALIKRLTQGGSGKALTGLRRVKSSADVIRSPSQRRRTVAPVRTSNADLQAAGKEWGLLTAVQNTISSASARAPTALPMFPGLPAPSLADSPVVQQERKPQRMQLLRGGPQEAAKKVEALASQLMARPRGAVQQTLDNCQANVRMLSEYLQNMASLPRLTAGESSSPTGGSRGGKFVTNSGVRAPQSASSTSEAWSPLGALSARELAAVEAVLGESAMSSTDASTAATASATAAQWQAEKRKKRQASLEGRSSLKEGGRNVAIVTTAALPWMTGTAVNPLLRAAYLAHEEEKRGESGSKVTLVIPWLALADQARVYPNNLTFANPEEQETYVRNWVQKRTGFDCNFKVTFYPGRYASEKGSILPVGDPTKYIPDSEADVAVLEEPEHLNWYHHGTRWTDKFNHVVGVMHTNYVDYARREENGAFKEIAVGMLNQFVTRLHCDKVVKLSDAVQPLPRQTTQFVHGVPDSFLAVGEKKSQPAPEGEARFSRGAYFMGKAVWAKGYTELLDLMGQHAQREGPDRAPPIDCYGNGEDLQDVAAASAAKRLPLSFHGAKDHLDDSMHEYKVFINPSRSDVVATTTAEALAMGKWAIVQEHPSNTFFSGFSNCLVYRTPAEFSRHLNYALANDPNPMSPAERKRLTWEDATQRFLEVAELGPADRQGPLTTAVDKAAWSVFNGLTGAEPLRIALGAGANTRDNPTVPLEQFEPTDMAGMGGLFDDKRYKREETSTTAAPK